MSLKKLIMEVNEAIEEAKKLTTKDRKKLKSSTFCGPNRSFPIPDCLHVRVGKAYLKRSKFSAATKKKIAACINRKAKALGCNVTKKAKAVSNEFTVEEQKLFDSNVFKTTRELVEQSINNPDLNLNFGDDVE